MKRLRWQNALILGASGALGTAFARLLSSEGAHLHLHCHTHGKAARSLAHELAAKVLTADLARQEGQEALAAYLERLEGDLGMLVCTVGTPQKGAFADLGTEEMDRLLRTNLHAPILAVRTALPHMLRAGYGRILLTGSVWGHAPASGEVVYGAAKAGLHGFVKSLAKELSGSGVTVNALAPWAFESPMLDTFGETEKGEMHAQTPSRRPLTAEEVARAAWPFLDPDSPNLSGQVLTVGWV